MSVSPAGLLGPRERAPGLTFPALAWALLHVPLFLALYAGAMVAAVRATPEGFRLALWPSFVPQAALLALVGFLAGLPFRLSRRVYPWAAGAVLGLTTGVLALDARIFQSVGFHLNGFFLRVLLQPNALKETGVPVSDVVLFVSGAVAFVLLDAVLGGWFIRRIASRRRTWAWALAILLLSAGERVYGAVLAHLGGPSAFAASTVLPLQVPVRMEGTLRKITGRTQPADAFAGASASKRLPAGVAPDAIRLTRTPDVVFVLTESLPADHLDERTMPNLWRRAQGGARFTSHYAAASATNYTLFSLVYGLQSQKLEATVGAGRQPVLFPALAANGYQTKVLAASCVDWMGLKETVFGGVQGLETWCDSVEPAKRDGVMLESGRAFIAQADPSRPVFLFLFFFGTHFNYFYGPEDRVFVPDWDGSGGLKATTVDGALIKSRARNAAHAVDRTLEGFLSEVEARRGRAPLVVFTGDHGEEFREKGHIGHANAVTREQIHVPAVLFGPGVPQGTFDGVTSHVDVVPTLLALLGDAHPPSLYSDGMSMFQVPADRFVVSTIGWEPRYAAIGKDLKVTMYAGLGTAQITDPDDREIPDGAARMAASAGKIMKALRGEATETAQPSGSPSVAPANAPATPQSATRAAAE